METAGEPDEDDEEKPSGPEEGEETGIPYPDSFSLEVQRFQMERNLVVSSSSFQTIRKPR